MKLYGSLNNRFEENKNYGDEIKVGTDITMYYWSDRHCYYVTRVINQKHIFVKPYEVCANQDEEGGMGHQNWKYFKTVKEYNEYLLAHGLNGSVDTFENPEEEWQFRYGHWYQVNRYSRDTYDHVIAIATKDCKVNCDPDAILKLARFYLRELTDEEIEDIKNGKEIVKYQKIKQGISFNIRDYYYDWEF